MSSAEDNSLLCVESGTQCSHRRLRDTCDICVAKVSCPHGKVPSRSVTCGSGSTCIHGRQRSQCVACGGKAICVHGRIRSRCAECGGSGLCEHGRRRYRCRMCIEAKAAIEAAKGAFNIRAHFLGEDGSAVAVMEDFERQDEPEPTRNEVQDFAVSGGDADERWGARRPNAPADVSFDELGRSSSRGERLDEMENGSDDPE